jgi:hypothetical protein
MHHKLKKTEKWRKHEKQSILTAEKIERQVKKGGNREKRRGERG